MRLLTIIAHYNSHQWMEVIIHRKRWPGDILIVDKSDDPQSVEELEIVNRYVEGTINVITRPNIGREGETYLTWIQENYSELPDYTIFTQDDWKNHFVPAEMEKMLRVMELRSRTPGGLDFFYQLPCSWKEGHGIVRRPIVNGQCDLHTFPSKDAILRWSSEFGVPLPPVYLTFTCAFFVVGRARIHRRSKEWWGRMREWLMRGETPDCSNPKAGYALEHMWLPIFTFF